MFIYIVLFYWKTYAYLIDVVFEVVKELLYAVFFGFTKPIKRPSEMNLALTISLSLHNTLPAPGRGSWIGAGSSLRRRSASPARGPWSARQGGPDGQMLAGPRGTRTAFGPGVGEEAGDGESSLAGPVDTRARDADPDRLSPEAGQRAGSRQRPWATAD